MTLKYGGPKLVSRDELLQLPTDNYDKRAIKEASDIICLLNEKLKLARSNNELVVRITVNKITDLAFDIVKDELEKANYKVDEEESEDKDLWLRVSY